MKISGFKKQTLIDYPGHISAVVFTQGCNFRCPFCHNPELVLPEKFGKTYSENHIFEYLNKYQHLLDAVSITGGEPTLHEDLPDLIRRIKNLNLKVKLDTNGTNPEILEYMINKRLLDFIAMDIKNMLDFELYNKTVGYNIHKNMFEKIKKSIELIQNSKLDYEFRTTVLKNYHRKEDIFHLKQKFGKHYKIQSFNPDVVLNPEIEMIGFKEDELF